MEQSESDPHGKGQHEPGAKLDADKSDLTYLRDFPRALRAVCDVATYGAIKYTESGWQHVPNGPRRYTAAGFRHLLPLDGTFDAQSNFRHLAHAAWNSLAALELTLREAEKTARCPTTRIQAPSASNPLLAAACECATRGWAVFPHETGRGITARDATMDLTKIRDYWERFPDANVGVACGSISNLCVVDLCGQPSKDLCESGYINPRTVCQVTPDEHYQYFYQYQPNTREQLDGLTFANLYSDEESVLVPPSVVGGKTNPHVWVCGKGPGDIPLAALPEVYVVTP